MPSGPGVGCACVLNRPQSEKLIDILDAECVDEGLIEVKNAECMQVGDVDSMSILDQNVQGGDEENEDEDVEVEGQNDEPQK